MRSASAFFIIVSVAATLVVASKGVGQRAPHLSPLAHTEDEVSVQRRVRSRDATMTPSRCPEGIAQQKTTFGVWQVVPISFWAAPMSDVSPNG
jgi:hypothetical protein